MMVLTAIIAVSLIPISAFGFDAVVISVLLFLGMLSTCFWKLRPLGISILLFCGFLFFIAMTSIRTPSRGAMCRNNLKSLSLAIINYSAGKGRFPPPYSVDEDGHPLHSWRVLILPHLEEQALYDDLDLSKPWDHPDNLQHAYRMPTVFRCPSYKPNPKDPFADVMTSYVAIVGQETIWNPDANGVVTKVVMDGLSNTIQLIESDSNRVHWMSPLDLRFEQIVPLDTSGLTNILKSHHKGGTHVSYCDGHVNFVEEDIPADRIRAAATKNGREVESLDGW